MYKPAFSIIVPIWQDIRILQLFLNSLNETITLPTQFIFINDGVGVVTTAVVEGFFKELASNCTYELIQHESPKGAGASINEGFNIATGEIITILDSDVILFNEWQLVVQNHFNKFPECGVLGAKLLYPQSGGIQHCGLAFTEDLGRHLYLNAEMNGCDEEVLKLQSVIFAFCNFREEVIEEVGRLDTNYFNGYEDMDYQFRAKSKGYEIHVNTALTAYHWEFSNGPHRTQNRKRNLGRFWRKWGNDITADLWSFVDNSLHTNLAQSSSNIVGIDLAEVRTDAKAFWDICDQASWLNFSDIEDFSYRVADQDAIWLPKTLDADTFRRPQQLLLLTDNFVQLLENRYWIECRQTVRSDDFVADLYGNVLPLKQLLPQCWPGSKIR